MIWSDLQCFGHINRNLSFSSPLLKVVSVVLTPTILIITFLLFQAFLQKYFKEASVLHQSDKSVMPTEQWVLVCDHVLSRTCEDGIQFQLKQADVSLLCQVIHIFECVFMPNQFHATCKVNYFKRTNVCFLLIFPWRMYRRKTHVSIIPVYFTD